MSFLIDTDVISQLVKDQPVAGVFEWLCRHKSERLYLSVVTIEELREGIEMMPMGKKRSRLDLWLSEELLEDFTLELTTRTLPQRRECMGYRWPR